MFASISMILIAGFSRVRKISINAPSTSASHNGSPGEAAWRKPPSGIKTVTGPVFLLSRSTMIEPPPTISSLCNLICAISELCKIYFRLVHIRRQFVHAKIDKVRPPGATTWGIPALQAASSRLFAPAENPCKHFRDDLVQSEVHHRLNGSLRQSVLPSPGRRLRSSGN